MLIMNCATPFTKLLPIRRTTTFLLEYNSSSSSILHMYATSNFFRLSLRQECFFFLMNSLSLSLSLYIYIYIYARVVDYLQIIFGLTPSNSLVAVDGFRNHFPRYRIRQSKQNPGNLLECLSDTWYVIYAI